METDRKNHLRYVRLEITRSCNLNCKFCYLDKDNAKIDKDRFTRLLDELVEMGVFTITFTGGEPFVEKDIFSFIEQARDKGFRLIIFTNGTMINRDTAQWLFDYGVTDINLSLYGASEETYENFTGKRMFQKTFQAIKCLVAAHIKTTVFFSINKITWKDTPEVKNLFKDMDNINFMFSTRICPSRKRNFSPLEYALLLEEIIPKLNEWGIEVSEHKRPAEVPAQMRLPIPCQAGIERCDIAADGGVLPCAIYPVEVGNIYQQSLKEIWCKSEYLIRLRKLKLEDFVDCNICNYQGVCQLRCPAFSVAEMKQPTSCPTGVFSRVQALDNFWQERKKP